MMSIHCAVRLTRRRTINQVLDETGGLEFSSESLIECVLFIETTGQKIIPIQDDNLCYFIEITRWMKATTPWISPWESAVGKALAKNQDRGKSKKGL